MMRPQFGSPPCQLVFTSGLFATDRATASASFADFAKSLAVKHLRQTYAGRQ